MDMTTLALFASVIMTVLKLVGFITFGWLVVFSPLIASGIIITIVFIFAVIVSCLQNF